MTGSQPTDKRRPSRPGSPSLWLPPLVLAGVALAAAPFYSRVMENLLWMGQTVRALCGF